MKSYLKASSLRVATDAGEFDLSADKAGRWIGGGLSIDVVVAELDNGVIITPTLVWAGDVDRRIRSVEVIHTLLPGTALRFLRFGLNMPGDPVRFGYLDHKGMQPSPLPAERAFCRETEALHMISSNSLVAFVSLPGTQITVIGNSTFSVSEGTLRLYCHKKRQTCGLIYTAILDGLVMAAPSSKQLDPLIVLTGGDLNDLLEQWADHTAAQTQPLIPTTPPTGWNDWQYYRNEKTQHDVLASATVLRDLKQQGYPLSYIQVDGGFCRHLSEWSEPQPSFADGMEALSNKVTCMGLKFGGVKSSPIQAPEASACKWCPTAFRVTHGFAPNGSPRRRPGASLHPAG